MIVGQTFSGLEYSGIIPGFLEFSLASFLILNFTQITFIT